MSGVDNAGNIWGALLNGLSESVGEIWSCCHFADVGEPNSRTPRKPELNTGLALGSRCGDRFIDSPIKSFHYLVPYARITALKHQTNVVVLNSAEEAL